MFLRSLPSGKPAPRTKKPTPARRHPELARDLLFGFVGLANRRRSTVCFLERVEKVASWPVWSFLTPCPPSLTARSSLGTSGAQRRLRASVGEPDRSLLSGSPSLPRLSGRGMQGRGRGLGLSSHPLRRTQHRFGAIKHESFRSKTEGLMLSVTEEGRRPLSVSARQRRSRPVRCGRTSFPSRWPSAWRRFFA